MCRVRTSRSPSRPAAPAATRAPLLVRARGDRCPAPAAPRGVGGAALDRAATAGQHFRRALDLSLAARDRPVLRDDVDPALTRRQLDDLTVRVPERERVDDVVARPRHVLTQT